MNGNALKLRRAIEKRVIIGLDTAPFVYFIEDVAPYADLLEPCLGCWKIMPCAPSPRP
jgi:hypothetical protein